jgi:hypothetical protein
MTRLEIVLIAVLIAAPALAQQPAPPEHQLSLSDTDLNVVWSALKQRPWDEVNLVMMKIQGQVIADQQRLAEAAKRAQDAEIDKRVKDAAKPPAPAEEK